MKPTKRAPRTLDSNQWAHSVVAATTEDLPEEAAKNPAAVALGRLGGAKGGKARAASLTPKQRSQIAQMAAKARWGKKKGGLDPKRHYLHVLARKRPTSQELADQIKSIVPKLGAPKKRAPLRKKMVY